MKSALLAAVFTLAGCEVAMRPARAAPAPAVPEASPQTFSLPLDAGVTGLTVEVSGKGRICGPARVIDSNGRVLIALGAGHCVAAGR